MSVSGFKFFEQEYRSSGVQEFRSSGVQENPEPEDLPRDRSDLSWSKGYNPPLSRISVAALMVGLESPCHAHSELLNSSILNSFQAFAHYVYSVLIRRRLLVRPLLRIGTL
jgi:hypothetical protein